MVPRLGSIASKVWEAAVLQTGNPWFQDWEALVPTCGIHAFLKLETRGSEIGDHWFQGLGTVRLEN